MGGGLGMREARGNRDGSGCVKPGQGDERCGGGGGGGGGEGEGFSATSRTRVCNCKLGIQSGVGGGGQKEVRGKKRRTGGREVCERVKIYAVLEFEMGWEVGGGWEKHQKP